MPNLSVLSQQLPPLEAIQAERKRRATDAARDNSREAVRARCSTLAGFIREAWPVLEPSAPYVHGWHIDAIAQHLEAVTDGRIKRLLINVPPGLGKSLLVSVFWPAWEWGPAGLASMRYLTTSYSENFTKRDARRMRDLINSDWYQALWGDRVRLVREAEMSFANSETGSRDARPFASLTGGRGDRVIIDDPHSTETAESEADRTRTIRIFRESVPLRVNDPEKSAIVIIMQRLHQNDVSGVAIDLKLGYEHLMLPMEFEPERACHTSIGFTDPRSYDGELLFPERFSRETLERDKVPLGGFGVAGQLQQRPAPRGGLMFKRAWFTIVKAAPAGMKWVRGWDLAASITTEAAYTAGVKLGRDATGRFCIGHAVRGRETGAGVRRLILNTASIDGRSVEIDLPQDPGQAGKTQAQDFIAMLAGYTAFASPETGDKETRAQPIAAQAEAGNVSIVEGPWNEELLAELESFPASKFKDQVDALSRAFGRLVRVGTFSFGAGPILVTEKRTYFGDYVG